MADAIGTHIEDEDLRRRMGANALKTAARYDLEGIGAWWEDLLSGLVARRCGFPSDGVSIGLPSGQLSKQGAFTL